MYHDLPGTARFWWGLFLFDQYLANAARENGCSCGGRLHSADYLRKPRGGPARLHDFLGIRFSFCCDREGCRKRTTPPSVRFLGRKVYLGAIVILISALRHGPSPRRVRELSERFDVDQRTIARWQVFWREQFPQTHFWKIEGARFRATIKIIGLPYSLVDAFLSRHRRCKGWTLLLRFLAPITTPGVL
jgi:hypothetical protein